MAREKNSKQIETEKSEKFTIADAFSPFLQYTAPESGSHPWNDRELPESLFEIERGLRAIAFLLDSSTDHGNEPLDAYAAIGVGRILDRYADRIDQLKKFAEQEQRRFGQMAAVR